MGTGGNKEKRKIYNGQEDMKDIRTQRIPTRERISVQDSIPVKYIITENIFFPLFLKKIAVTLLQ